MTKKVIKIVAKKPVAKAAPKKSSVNAVTKKPAGKATLPANKNAPAKSAALKKAVKPKKKVVNDDGARSVLASGTFLDGESCKDSLTVAPSLNKMLDGSDPDEPFGTYDGKPVSLVKKLTLGERFRNLFKRKTPVHELPF